MVAEMRLTLVCTVWLCSVLPRQPFPQMLGPRLAASVHQAPLGVRDERGAGTEVSLRLVHHRVAREAVLMAPKLSGQVSTLVAYPLPHPGTLGYGAMGTAGGLVTEVTPHHRPGILAMMQAHRTASLVPHENVLQHVLCPFPQPSTGRSVMVVQKGMGE
jgi:hypothetical protein